MYFKLSPSVPYACALNQDIVLKRTLRFYGDSRRLKNLPLKLGLFGKKTNHKNTVTLVWADQGQNRALVLRGLRLARVLDQGKPLPRAFGTSSNRKRCIINHLRGPK